MATKSNSVPGDPSTIADVESEVVDTPVSNDEQPSEESTVIPPEELFASFAKSLQEAQQKIDAYKALYEQTAAAYKKLMEVYLLEHQ